MAAPRQRTLDLRSRAPHPAQISFAELPQHELAEFIDPIDLPNALPAGLDVTEYEPECDD
jgi:hypothetical protein